MAVFVVVVLLVAGVVAATFEFVLRSDPSRIAGRYDIFRYYAPLTYYVDNRIAEGEFPFWNPLTYCGVPNVGNPQSFIFYPPNLLRSVLIAEPTPYRTGVSMVIMWGLHLVLMGVSLFYLARAHRMSASGAFTSVIVLVCSALVVRRMTEFHFLLTMAWLPLILLLVKTALDRERMVLKLAWSLGAALLLGLSILGGFLQIVNLMGVAIGSYGVLYSLLKLGPEPANWRWSLRRWSGDVLVIAVVIVLASLVGAATLLPARELTAFTVRQAGMETPLFADLRTWDVMKFIKSLVMFAGPQWEPETIRLSGVLSIVLAAAAVTNRHRRDVALFGMMLLVFFELSFGPPFPLSTVVEWLTPFSQSAYTRGWDFLLVPFALLAGFGLDALVRPPIHRGAGVARSLLVLYVGLLALVPLAVWLKPDYYVAVGREVIAIPAVGLGVIAAISLARLHAEQRIAASRTIVVMVFLEVFAWNSRYVPELATKHFKELVPIQAGATEIPLANTRDADPVANRFLYSLRFSMNGVDPLHFGAVRDMVSGPPREAHPYRAVHNWETTRENTRGNLLFKRSFWLAQQYVVGPMPGKEALFPPTTTVFLDEAAEVGIPEVPRDAVPDSAVSDRVVTMNLDDRAFLFEPVRGDRTLPALRVELPKAAMGVEAGSAGVLHSALRLHYESSAPGEMEFWIDEPGSFRSTHGKRHAIRRTGPEGAVMEIALPDYPEMSVEMKVAIRGAGEFRITRAMVDSDLGDEDGAIRIASRGANYTELTVGPLDGPRVLSYLDADYPGWRVIVDGEAREMVPAFGPFKGVALGEGTHAVRFEFVPKLTYAATGVSVGTMLLTLVGLVVLAVAGRARGSGK